MYIQQQHPIFALDAHVYRKYVPNRTWLYLKQQRWQKQLCPHHININCDIYMGPESYDRDLSYHIIADFTTRRYCSIDLAQQYCCAAISWFWNWSVTRVQSVGPYNLRLSKLAVTSRYESSRSARRGKERQMWLVSWSTQMMSRTGRIGGAYEQTVNYGRWPHQGHAGRTRGLTTSNDIMMSQNCTRYKKKFPRFKPHIYSNYGVYVFLLVSRHASFCCGCCVKLRDLCSNGNQASVALCNSGISHLSHISSSA